MKFEKIDDKLFKKEEVLSNQEMSNTKGGLEIPTGCGKAYFASEDVVKDVCEWYDTEKDRQFYRLA